MVCFPIVQNQNLPLEIALPVNRPSLASKFYLSDILPCRREDYPSKLTGR
jgi:hypothetical protein